MYDAKRWVEVIFRKRGGVQDSEFPYIYNPHIDTLDNCGTEDLGYISNMSQIRNACIEISS